MFEIFENEPLELENLENELFFQKALEILEKVEFEKPRTLTNRKLFFKYFRYVGCIYILFIIIKITFSYSEKCAEGYIVKSNKVKYIMLQRIEYNE